MQNGAFKIALDHPENVTALIIMGTFVGAEPPEKQAGYMGLLDRFKTLKTFDDELLENTWPFFYAPNLPKNSPLIDEVKQHLLNAGGDRTDDVYTIGHAIFNRASNLEKLSSLKMPFGIVVGRGDIARVPAESEEMAKAADTKNLYYIENAGHISSLENPASVNKCLLNFLEENLAQTKTQTFGFA